ncbi:unnamed protein product [Pleuronectes platessa]|uniref:Uncharacterized protein n=1 Tax=Pleuronectes platessa TaxID=8262 RepID=A0A9N7Z0N5_PLEPL|nr:unnamed protein product [Pleuronectes platessa]
MKPLREHGRLYWMLLPLSMICEDPILFTSELCVCSRGTSTSAADATRRSGSGHKNPQVSVRETPVNQRVSGPESRSVKQLGPDVVCGRAV